MQKNAPVCRGVFFCHMALVRTIQKRLIANDIKVRLELFGQILIFGSLAFSPIGFVGMIREVLHEQLHDMRNTAWPDFAQIGFEIGALGVIACDHFKRREVVTAILGPLDLSGRNAQDGL